MSGPLDLSMGSPIAKSLQDLIQAKLVERRYTTADDSSQFAEFITVMISNGKNRQQVSVELGDLIGPEFDIAFTEWIFKQLEILQYPQGNGEIRDETIGSDQMDMDITPGGKPSRGTARSNPYPAPRFFNQITKSMERSTSSDRRRRSPPNVSPNLSTGIPTGPRAMREDQPNGHRNVRRYNNQGPLRGPMGNAKLPYTSIPPQVENGFLINPNFGRNLHERMGLPNPDENLTVVTPKPRCRHWPTCQLGATCKFSHPSQLCQKFPNCPNMTGTCPDIHPDDQILQQPPSSFQVPFNSNPFPQMNQFNSGPFQPPYSSFQVKTFVPPVHHVPDLGQKDLKGDSPVCKFADKCTKADCPFAHPTPAAEPGKGLILREERCDAGKQCSNPECDKVHPSPAILTETSTNSQETCKFFPNCKNPSCTFKHEATKVPVLCRNGENCTRPGCHFIHPIPVKCRFGVRCTNEICHFQHPERAPVVSRNMVWRAEDHVSERPFAAPSSTETLAVIKDEVMVE